MSDRMKRFYAMQPGAIPPAQLSMGINRPAAVPAAIETPLSTVHFNRLGALALTESRPPVSVVTAPVASTEPSLVARVYQTPMDRKEFLATAVGVGLMGLSVKTLIERRLQRQFPNPITSSPRGFGAGPYGG